MRVMKVWLPAVGIAALLGVAAVKVVDVAIPEVGFLMEYGCGDAEDRLGEALAGDAVLDDEPDGAGAGEAYDGCDDDDLFVVAGKSYTYDEGQGRGRESDVLVHESVLAHYRDAAQANGWRYRSSGCFSKSIDGTTAYLTIDGPADGALDVEIIATRESSEPYC
ncbi:hypothetical protein PV367_37505 [Streptomyces europaeiscabiei]|uniref:Uncharacterized protein n=1 Tax=Streptomyces europaeiscabiei TaxID=146819 RepID=A0AAJ2PY10_9ACTN|nr:hypothetical protein [Streptomyces europaeiscabiei]MDX3135366.1 hypothetical protein [Streptomyces europaeiscabiei]